MYLLLFLQNLIVEQLSKILSSFYSVESSPETDIHKNIPTIASEPVLPTLAPSIQKNIISNNSNVLCNKSINSTFQTKLSDLVPDFRKTMSSKLSRKRDSETPSSKRRRTTSSFSTPPNDIHRHINTLKSFFSADKEGVKDAPALDLEISCNAQVARVPSVEKDSVNAHTREVSPLNNQFSAVTVQRADSSGTPARIGQFSSALQRAETPLRINQFSGVTLKTAESDEASVISELFKDSALQKAESNETLVISKQFNGVGLQGDENNETSVKRKQSDANEGFQLSDKETKILPVTNGHPKVHLSDFHNSSFRSKNGINENLESTNSINNDEWSRGLHPVEKAIQVKNYP